MGTGRKEATRATRKMPPIVAWAMRACAGRSADRGLGDEGLRGEKFDDERAEDGGDNHKRKGDAENVPETFDERARGGNEGLDPRLRDRDFDWADDGRGRVYLT
jgi:hypothetical protein